MKQREKKTNQQQVHREQISGYQREKGLWVGQRGERDQLW